GPIRIGMSEDEVRALGLEEREGDWRSRLFGPYRVYFDDGRVRRIEASIGALGRSRVGEHVFPSGTHIHQLRDAFGGCEWYEGGGERYRCAGGTLFVSTAHTMDPARYTIAVEDRERFGRLVRLRLRAREEPEPRRGILSSSRRRRRNDPAPYAH